MNGKIDGSSLLIPALIAGLSLLISVPVALGGNKEMVEKNVRELDTLNREVIQQIPELPSDGHVRVKARITQTGVKREIDILHTEIILPDSVDTATTTSTSVIEQTEVIPTETTESQETRKQEINFNDHHQKVSPN